MEETKEAVQEAEEVIGLRDAFNKIKDKIESYRHEIAVCEAQIASHEQQIVALQEMLKTNFGNLVGEISGTPVAKKMTKNKNKSLRGSTSELIYSCLQRAGKAVDTKYVIKYLRDHGNETNPSVELNRMKKKGLISQPERGLYEWIPRKSE